MTNPYTERTLVIHVRCPEGLAHPRVWLSLYDSGEVTNQSLISMRGELTEADLPYSLGDALADLLHGESGRQPRLI